VDLSESQLCIGEVLAVLYRADGIPLVTVGDIDTAGGDRRRSEAYNCSPSIEPTHINNRDTDRPWV
jgi:hypothetical protein